MFFKNGNWGAVALVNLDQVLSSPETGVSLSALNRTLGGSLENYLWRIEGEKYRKERILSTQSNDDARLACQPGIVRLGLRMA